VFINPDFRGVKAKSFGVILAFARKVEMKHLKLLERPGHNTTSFALAD
jgi:hypothetical protein